MNLTNLVQQQKQSNEFFLPVGLSSFQLDLIEVLIKLHKNSITNQVKGIKEETGTGCLSSKDLNTLFKRNLLSIQNHPYLLVEHYMPKQLLLMESHERLMIASDKFRTFDLLIDSIKSLRLNLVVVGHNIKELDLIEAFIMGRELSYKRFSGRKLYEEIIIESNNTEKKHSKDDDYAPKPKPAPVKDELSLNLISSQQMYNTKFKNVDIIISFDSSLKLESNDIPIIKLIVLNSDNHAELSHKVNNFDCLVDRYKKIEPSIDFRKVGEFFKDIKNNQWPYSLDSLPAFNNHSNDDILNSLNDLEFLNDNSDEGKNSKRIKLQDQEVDIPNDLNIKDYKNLLAKLTIERISKMENKYIENQSKLYEFELNSTISNNKDDDLKLNIGSNFKSLNELKESVIGIDKKNDRTKLEYENLLKIETQLKETRDLLNKELNDENKLKEEIKEESKDEIKNESKEEIKEENEANEEKKEKADKQEKEDEEMKEATNDETKEEAKEEAKEETKEETEGETKEEIKEEVKEESKEESKEKSEKETKEEKVEVKEEKEDKGEAEIDETKTEKEDKKDNTEEEESKSNLSKIDQLKEKLNSLKLSNEEIENDLTKLRVDYQEITTNAAELSTISKAKIAQNNLLDKKLKNEASLSLRNLKNEQIKSKQASEIKQLSNQISFLNIYKEILEKNVKEKISTLNVGRNGRVHRSTTPYT